MNPFISRVNFKRVVSFLRPLALPGFLALLFAAQNYAFNWWLGLSPHDYLGRFLLVNLGLGLALYGPSIFLRHRAKHIYLFCMAGTLSLVFILQFGYYEYSQSFLQVSAMKYIGQAFSVRSSATAELSWKFLLFLVNWVAAGVFCFLAYKQDSPPLSPTRKAKFALLFLVFLVAFGGYYVLIHQEKKEWGSSSRLYKDVYDIDMLIKKVGIVNFTLEDAVKYITRVNLVSAADQQFLQDFRLPARSVGNPSYQGIARGRNIIFLQIESLERATINTFVEGQEITPNINRLVAQGLYFSNYYTQVGPGNTADAEFSTLNSLYPLQSDVVFANYAQNHFEALPSVLSGQGYSTHALNGDVKTFWNRSGIYPNLGYQQQINEDEYVKTRSIGKGPTDLGDSDFLSQSVRKLQSFKAPFFATLITESSHTPFVLPEDLQGLKFSAASPLTYTQQQYLQSVHYTDQAVGDFIGQLKKTGLYENSVIVLYGDHGSFTGISQALGKANGFKGLQNSEVPLMVLVPGTGLQGQITAPGSHVDLFPTLANLVGLKAPGTLLGQDMLNTATPVMTHRNIFSGTVNTILTDKLAFEANDDGVYEHGRCLQLPSQKSLPVENCRSLYVQQANITKVSDIIIRGNLLNEFAK